MKPLSFILLLGVFSFMISCEKGSMDRASLNGKWKNVANFMSVGGPDQVKSAGTGNLLIFNADGSLSGKAAEPYSSFSVKDSVTLTFKKADGTIQNFFYKIDDGDLSLSPSGPIMCFEGCSSLYEKIE